MKILLVEDAFLSREKETKVLQGLGHEVTQACDGEEALRLYKSVKPDAVITDLDMPYMDGFEVIRAVRKLNPGVPVLVCTSFTTDKEQVMKALQAGATEILSKPLDVGQIEKALSKVKKSAGY